MSKDCKPIVFEGVKFSREALKELCSLQEDGDEKLNACINDLTNLVFHLIKHNEYLTGEGKKFAMYLELLVFIRESFIRLKGDKANNYY